MTCAEFQQIVHELAHGDGAEAVSEPTVVIARLHAEICDSCAAKLDEARQLAKALAFAAEDTEILQPPAEMEERLAGAFREHHRNLERARYRARRSRLRWAEWTGLAAAAALLVSIGAWNLSRGHASKNGSSAVTVSRAVNSIADRVAPQEASTEMPSADFVPVPYGENLSAEDSEFVVRVSMTRGTLESLGYPVDEANSGDVIQADVLVGEDGSPVAVRLVQ